jgi:hypothetical protein
MSAVAIGLAAVLAVALVLWVARPFLLGRPEGAGEEDTAARERARLLEQRDRALQALKELEFDHRTGKITDDDYARLVPELRSEAAAALAALDERAAATGLPEPVAVDAPAARREEQAS